MSDTFSTFLTPANKEASKVILAAAAKHASTVFPCWWTEKVKLSNMCISAVSQAVQLLYPKDNSVSLCLGCWTAPLLQQSSTRGILLTPYLFPKASKTLPDVSFFSGTLFPEQFPGELGGLYDSFFWLIFNDYFQLRWYLPLEMATSFPLERSMHLKGASDKQFQCRYYRRL